MFLGLLLQAREGQHLTTLGDIVVAGTAEKVSDKAELNSAAGTFESKYGPEFTAPQGTWFGLGDAIRKGGVLLYRVTPSIAFGFGKGKRFSQTRWTFS